MTITDRIETMQVIFERLQTTNSRLRKQEIVDLIIPELRDDFEFCLEVLAGKHKLGYKYKCFHNHDYTLDDKFKTIKDIVIFLQEPLRQHDLTQYNIDFHIACTALWGDFLEPLCNREYKLGIGQSLLEPDTTAPMLAKKFEGQLPFDGENYFITEKLDGNRCISYFDGEEWQFVSRNGKRMNVEFDMSGLPEELVYDGEVISPEQMLMSENIWQNARNNYYNIDKYDVDFNSTSGLINRHTTDKSLVYCIFDIQDNSAYTTRRKLLDILVPKASNVKILPVLGIFYDANDELVDKLLELVVSAGGEGLMLNCGSALYVNKRTNALLKYKPVYTMDMLVKGTYPGSGKYTGMVGGITCETCTSDGKRILVNVGSGLSDEQRFRWKMNSEDIVGKIVEIAYFGLSQDALTKGTNVYSMRFPRLKKVRTDKNSTSEY